MSKPCSGHFFGTTGYNTFQYLTSFNLPINSVKLKKEKELDLHEHPIKYKQLNSKKIKIINNKIKNRTATRGEYKQKQWQYRFYKRRQAGIDEFWSKEKGRIMLGLPTTRNWSAEQQQDILKGKRPKYNGKSMHSHHTYSAAKYPHLANVGELIYPATPYEHLHSWHGGNYKNSLPGRKINNYKDF